MIKTISTSIICFAVAVSVVISGFSLLDFEKTAIAFWAFGSLLFSFLLSLITAMTFFLLKQRKNKVIHFAGLSSAILFYEIIVIASVALSPLFDGHLNQFIFTQIAANATYIILVTTISFVSGKIKDNNKKDCGKLESGEYSKPKRGGF